MKRGDIVTMEAATFSGVVLRVARDGSWVDVDWGGWSKRQRDPSKLILVEEGVEQ